MIGSIIPEYMIHTYAFLNELLFHSAETFRVSEIITKVSLI